jgi:hypothetical protein
MEQEVFVVAYTEIPLSGWKTETVFGSFQPLSDGRQLPDSGGEALAGLSNELIWSVFVPSSVSNMHLMV